MMTCISIYLKLDLFSAKTDFVLIVLYFKHLSKADLDLPGSDGAVV